MRQNRFIKIFLLFILIKSSPLLLGFDGPINIKRACINFSDSNASIFFSDLSNPCGTFVSFKIFGRPDNTTAYAEVFESFSMPISPVSIKQPNLKQWEYYIIFSNMCDGISKLYSDTIKLDFTAPLALELDSVSISLSTQKTVIGWPFNPSPDFKGYLVFTQAGSNNIEISNQRGEYYTDLSSNPEFIAHSYSFASYDSCGNVSIISNPHITILSRGSLNFCKRSYQLAWTAYVGWQSRIYYIYLKTNGNNFVLIDSTSSLNYLINNLAAGNSYEAYIRSSKTGSSFTSSSNILLFSLPLAIKPINTTILSIQVQGADNIKIKWQTNQSMNVKVAKLYRGTRANNITFIKNIPHIDGENYTFDNINTEMTSLYYQIKLFDSCDIVSDSSRINQSIFIENVGDTNLFFNPYIFEKGIFVKGAVESQRSTWNIEKILFTDSLFSINNFDTSLCYRVISISSDGDTSISNTICINIPLNFYIPNALNLNSSSGKSIFTVIGVGIDWDKTEINIFNRWGEKIGELSNNNITWDGTYQNEKVKTGIYIYTGVVFGKKNSKQAVKGFITVID